MAKPVVTLTHPDGRTVTLIDLPQAVAGYETAGYTRPFFDPEPDLTPDPPTKPRKTRSRTTGDGGTDTKDTE